MTSELLPRRDAAFYESLGLVANPFVTTPEDGVSLGVSLEVESATNALYAALVNAAGEPNPKPILVSKGSVPSYYPLRAIANVEAALVADGRLNVLHSYIQLYMLRKGRVRSTLGVVGERLAFRSFDETLGLYLRRVAAEPDQELIELVGVEASVLDAFAESLAADPTGAAVEYFGDTELERRPELSEVLDIRLASLEADVDESETAPELDATVGEAPGTGFALPEEVDREVKSVVDYVVAYTEKHLSRVVARGLRVYRERGLAALSAELKVTKAPRKTLKALVDLASVRFDKTAIIYDGFDNWSSIAPDLRQVIVTSLTEMRWMLDGLAVFVLLLEEGRVPELEEQFGAATRIVWDFPGLEVLQDAPDRIDPEVVNAWLAKAARAGVEPMTLEDPVLARIAQDSEGSLAAFAVAAAAAIEDAAGRGLTALDDDSLQAVAGGTAGDE